MTKQNVNDKTILVLKKQIEDKKSALKTSERFTPVTNCSLELDGNRVNIQVLSKEQIINFLVRLNAYRLAAKDLDLLGDYTICGYSVDDWMKDLKSRLMNVNRTAELDKLKSLENRLHTLLSNEKKIELEIEEIASSIQ
jgi:hypothetical protein